MNVLSNDTRKIIDDARNTLVGQIPVPMMQCQQITLALTYKFMSDDDQRAERLGGERHYFAGDLDPYSWDKIMSLRLDDTQRSELYRGGLSALQESDSMPAVFREIFKDSVVPFGDHRTLALFLNTMDRMVYDDSEKLGDAYEYLLKTAEAQADAGQFRTPRHIIDFIVKIINPQKHEVIIDPACGTAGFLVSAYQHVKSQHELPGGGSSLSVPDLTRLSDNLKGYDISPEMTKLAMANMYLHTQDKDPNIDNYDTLTSTDHWNEYADVMLANPPFMTPKGGVRPHDRFRVSARRAEVLFVDYIASHLNEHGRAGIIVPEGIIFQSQNAYRQLRRFLLDESLVAVISLPGGVFNPYSGVKTSILILDKVLAPKTDYVGFFKVANDGYDLGSQRREIAENDLPAVQAELNEYLHRLRAGESLDDFAPVLGLVVAKERIADGGIYNLSGERYRELTQYKSDWPIVALSELEKQEKVQFLRGSGLSKKDIVEDGANLCILYGELYTQYQPIIDNVVSKTDAAGKVLSVAGDVLIPSTTTADAMGIAIARALNQDGIIVGADINVVRTRNEHLDSKFLSWLINFPLKAELARHAKGVNILHLSNVDIRQLQIPLPPMEVQREIVTEIEGYQRVMDGARAVVDSWRPRVHVDPEWPVVPLQDACDIQRGKFSHRPRNEPRFYGGDYPFIQTGDVARADGGKIHYTQTLNDEGLAVSKLFEPPLVVITIAANIGETAVLDYPCCFPDSVIGLIPDCRTDAWFLELMMRTKKEYLTKIAPQAAQKNINIEILKTVEIPLPPLAIQQSIVVEIEAERALVSANRELMERMEQRIQDTIARVWED